MLACEVCGRRAVHDAVALFRVNPPGVLPARWRCRVDMTAEQLAAVDPEVQEITDIIAQADDEPLRHPVITESLPPGWRMVEPPPPRDSSVLERFD
jgi:hypothetical protein